MKKLLFVLTLCLFVLTAKAQMVVSDPGSLTFQVEKWLTEKVEIVKQSAELVAISKTLKQGIDLYQQVDGVLKQSVYIKDCFKTQMDAADLAIRYVQYNPQMIANASIYKSYGENIMYNLSQLDELGRLINIILMPGTKLTTADRMKELRSINEDMRKKKEEIILDVAKFEQVNGQELLRKRLTNRIK